MNTMKKAAAAVTVLALAGLLGACAAPLEKADKPEAPATQAEDKPAPAVETPAEKEGTFKNPFAVGTAVGNDEVTFTVTGNLAAYTDYKAANQFNDDPVNGGFYTLPVTITNVEASDPVTPWIDVRVKLVSPDGRSWDSVLITGMPGDLTDVADLYPGGTATGNIAFDVPPDAMVPGLMAAMSYSFSDEVFITVL